jgi:1-acylglycerone phosphate reductase
MLQFSLNHAIWYTISPSDVSHIGLYNSSKAAATFISETLKMELAPLGVRVVTVMVVAIGTTLYNGHEVSLPQGSYYKPIEEYIKKQSRGEMQEPFNESVSVTARNLVKDTLAGRRGQIWRGGEAGRASILSWLVPTLRYQRTLFQGDRKCYFLGPNSVLFRTRLG